MTIKKLIQDLKDSLKSNLITIAEYGKDNQHLIILNKLDSTILKTIKPSINEYSKKTKKSPLLLTLEEIKDGIDVFPLEFLYMKLNHNILYGKNIFQNLKFDNEHVRRQLEFEFRSKLINLRQNYLEAKSKKQLKIISHRAIPTILPILYGLLFLKNEKISQSLDEILSLISKKYKIDMPNYSNKNIEENIKKLIEILYILGEKLNEMRL